MTKQEILDYLDNVLHPIVSPDNWKVYSDLHDMVEELPSAEPVRHGKWTVTPTHIKCSECGESFMLFPQNYCPNCGADMRGESDD